MPSESKPRLNLFYPVHSDPKTLPAYQALLTGGGSGLIPYSSPAPLVFPAPSRIYFTSTNPNLSGDACSALPASTPNLSDKVVIVRRGGCDFTVKLANVGKAGGFVSTLSTAFPYLPADEAIANLAAKLSWSTTPRTPSSFLNSTSAPLACKPLEVCATRKESRCVKERSLTVTSCAEFTETLYGPAALEPVHLSAEWRLHQFPRKAARSRRHGPFLRWSHCVRRDRGRVIRRRI